MFQSLQQSLCMKSSGRKKYNQAMKTLITHINPHLDDIAAIWLYQKYHPDFKEATIEFVSASNEVSEESEDQVYLGVGRGKYDEHKGDLNDCAASLVYKDLKEQGLTPTDEVELKALEELVEWVRLDDLGKLEIRDYPDFSIPAWIRTTDSSPESSLKTTEMGKEILNRILGVLERKGKAELEWQSKVEFESGFGKSYAIKGQAIDRSFCRDKGGDLFLMVDPTNGSVQYFTPSFEIDLEPIYKRVKKLDPEADWFLHQSHHMVICGSSSAPESKMTKLSFEELIQAAKDAQP
jgi:hypothetical protein